MEDAQLKAVLEALIFVSEAPLTLDRMKEVLGGVSKRDLQRLLAEMMEEYRKCGRGIHPGRRWPKGFSSAPVRNMPIGSGD